MHLNNKPARLFEEHYSAIVHIVCKRNIIREFADRLREARLISTSIIDQAEMMEVPMMQAKTIMGSVRTMVKRGVLPRKILCNFAYILNLPQFNHAFDEIVQNLQKQSKQ